MPVMGGGLAPWGADVHVDMTAQKRVHKRGFMAALVMGTDSMRNWGGEASRWVVAFELLIAVAGAIVFVLGVGLLV